MSILLAEPRRIDPAATFENITQHVVDVVQTRRAPGLIVGLSGTDSILCFLASAEALKRLGKPHRALGLNFEHISRNDAVHKGQTPVCVASDKNWVSQEIFPWLQQRYPAAQLEIDTTIEHSDDNKRWGHLFSRAVYENTPRAGMSHSHYFPVGTHNASEEALGTYSLQSSITSLMPIDTIYKSEVIQICEYLGVPQIAIEKSQMVDCDCGRFDVQANHMQELDWYIMCRRGELDKAFLRNNVSDEIRKAIMAFYVEETEANAFRKLIPYRSGISLAVTL